jgi:hypothetical protein
MTRARRSLDIFSCFGPDQLAGVELEHGARLLGDIVCEVAGDIQPSTHSTSTEPMLQDLANRLRQRGLDVALGYGSDIALVASSGKVAVAVETDSVLAKGTLRESLRLRPAALRRLGWHYVRVHTFELFADPEAVAARVAGIVGLSSQVTMEITPNLKSPIAPETAPTERYVARFADEGVAVDVVEIDDGERVDVQDDIPTAPLDIPDSIPRVITEPEPPPRQDAPPPKAAVDIPRADALDD